MEIKDFFETYQTAAWNKDKAAMINLYEKQAVIFDMWDQGFISDAAEWNKIIEDWFDSLGDEKVKIEFEMIKITQSGTVGFASALIGYQAISNKGALLRSMKNRITFGFSKSGEGWKITHQHVSAPISSEGLTAIFKI